MSSSGPTLAVRCFPSRENMTLSSQVALVVERFFFRYRGLLIWVHAAMFLFFIAVLAIPPLLDEPGEFDNLFTHFTLFSNYMMWGIWFPLVFISVIVTGRSWCGILCPMGAAAEWGNFRGLKREIPKWMRWPGTPIVSFLVITIWGQTVGVRDHPESLALVFGGTLVLAIMIGFIYGRNKRAWCRHMCPIGLLLGVFSRIGAIEFMPKRKKEGGDLYTEKTLCPTMIDLSRKKESRHCIECFRCVNPDSKGGVALRIRRPGEEIEEIAHRSPNMAEIWFFFLGTGIALGGFLWLVIPEYQSWRHGFGAWLLEREWWWALKPGPSWLMVVHPERREVFYWLDFITIVSFMVGVMILTSGILAATSGMAAWLSGRVGGGWTFSGRFIQLGYQYAPVAMVSLVIGLGAKLFDLMAFIGLTSEQIQWLKVAMFLISLVWSLWLSDRILKRQGVGATRRWLPLIPGIAGSLAVGGGWWIAIF